MIKNNIIFSIIILNMAIKAFRCYFKKLKENTLICKNKNLDEKNL